MKHYVCKYHVVQSRNGKPFAEFDVTDGIFSTSFPSNDSVAHYWNKHAEFCHYDIAITVYSVQEGPTIEDAIIENHKYL